MKYTTLILIQIFSIVFLATAQNTTVCAVKYKEYNTNLGTYNYWFYKDMYVHITEPNYKAQFINGFPVLINNVMTTQTDTLKFNKEFNEFVSDMKAQLTKAPGRVEIKQYNSDTTKSSIFLDGLKKNYVVLDTLVALNRWDILDDTETFMGYKCQKATINYNNEKYTAWFTTKLPYNAGPVDFRGLPGLILKVSNSSRKFGYEAVEILLPYKGVIPMFNSVGETISIRSVEWAALINEDNKKRKEAHDNMIKQLIKDGAIYHP
ncbi:MAG: GLPGLI family protein [Deinococcales bacterium]|nr:GLPGLI family protein [Chitinophagaceae bacterium]